MRTKRKNIVISNHTLDLHGVYHSEVGKKVDSFVTDHILKGSRSVFIITGNSVEMKKLVNKTLLDYSIISEETLSNSGIVAVSLT
jgi:DNA-nicking Smr family endonuclease